MLGLGSKPPSACKMSSGTHAQAGEREEEKTKRKERKKERRRGVTGPAALFMTTPADMAPEEQVVHNAIPLKDKMPPLGFSDVHGKAKSSPTVTFVRCQSDASHTDVRLFKPGRIAEHAAATQAVWGERDGDGRAAVQTSVL